MSRAFGVIPGQVTGYSKALSCRKKYVGFQTRKIAFVSQFFDLKNVPPLYKYFIINLMIYFKVIVSHFGPLLLQLPISPPERQL